MIMNIMRKKIVSLLIIAGVLLLSSCDSSEDSIAPAEIVNLTAEGKPGSIELNWDYSGDSLSVRYVEVRYTNPANNKETVKVASSYSDSLVIENTRKKYGEYSFALTPYSTTFDKGKTVTVSAVSERAPVQESYVSTELPITENDIVIDGIRDSAPENIFDGDINTFVNFDYSSASAGIARCYEIHLPSSEEYVKFMYITRNHPVAKFPAEIELSVKANESDDWTVVGHLEKDADDLPTSPAQTFVSKEYKAPFAFSYFRFRVLKVHTGSSVLNFSLAEFRVYHVVYSYYDPEAE